MEKPSTKFVIDAQRAIFERLLTLCTERGGQAKMAREMGISATQFSTIKHGHSVVQLDQVLSVMTARGLSPAWIFYGEGPQKMTDLIRLLKSAAPTDRERARKIREHIHRIKKIFDELDLEDEA